MYLLARMARRNSTNPPFPSPSAPQTSGKGGFSEGFRRVFGGFSVGFSAENPPFSAENPPFRPPAGTLILLHLGLGITPDSLLWARAHPLSIVASGQATQVPPAMPVTSTTSQLRHFDPFSIPGLTHRFTFKG